MQQAVGDRAPAGARVHSAFAMALLVLLASCGSATPHRAGADAATSRAAADSAALSDSLPPGAAAAFLPPVQHLPLDPPLVVTDDFGERRGNHFHAALDLSTGHRVGREVFAPGAGVIERVRASGGGYGRSIYLHADDGRTYVFGHLDAFDEPLASFVDSLQRATGAYEQDVSPPPGRFRVTAGARIAWSGESGVGPPHLHVEVRLGDMAMNPLRAGLAQPDTRVPVIRRVVIEPADERSYVERRPLPFEWRPEGSAPARVRTRTRRRLAKAPAGIARDTVVVEGRVRVRVDAQDGFEATRFGMAPYSIAVEFGDARVESRYDSLSWATDMPDVDQVYEGETTRLWDPAFRPRALRVRGRAATFEVRPGDPPRPLRVTARDVAGNATARVLWLVPPAVPGPDTSGAGPRIAGAFGVSYEVAGPGCLRVIVRGAPRASQGVTVALPPQVAPVNATCAGDAWVATIRVEHAVDASLIVRGRNGSGDWQREQPLRAIPANAGGPGVFEANGWHVAPGAGYDPMVLVVGRTTPRAAAELRPTGDALSLGPVAMPLRTPWSITTPAPAVVPPRLGLYQSEGGGWGFVRARLDSAKAFHADVRHLGQFALFEDLRAPRIVTRRPPRRAPTAAMPYSRWALEARVRDGGSGIDVAASRFTVDGAVVPTEFDPDAGVLRWRPRVPPARGAHAYEVTATDRAGNAARSTGRFVIN